MVFLATPIMYTWDVAILEAQRSLGVIVNLRPGASGRFIFVFFGVEVDPNSLERLQVKRVCNFGLQVAWQEGAVTSLQVKVG